jgi:phosphatidylinositol alpha-1,6-mannosyltransferase
MARALGGLRTKHPLLAVSLHDGDAGEFARVQRRSASGSRLRFAWELHRAALARTHFFYDFAGMARAHCRVPGFVRPYAVWAHGIEVWEQARVDRLAALRRAGLVFVNSAYTKRRAAALHAGFEHASVCWLGTETDEPPVQPGVQDGPPTVTILARLDADGGYKGHRELIAAFPQVVSAVPDARMCIAGGGPGTRLVNQWVAASSAREHIDVLGFVPEAEVPRLWARTTVFAMPSRGEGFGLAYIEAMRNSVPVIASVHDAAVEVNADGVTGYNIDLGRPGQLVERLIELLSDRDRAHALGQAAHTRWREHFTYSAFERRFLPLAETFIAAR